MISRAAAVWFVATYVATAALFAAAAVAPGVPYNIREVMGGRGFTAPLLLPLVLSLLLGTPVLAAARLARGSVRSVLLTPVAAISSGIVCYTFLRLSVPMESVWDIVGAPILAWPWEWELLGRFVALHAAVWLSIAGGASIAMARAAVVLRWAAVSVWSLPLCYAIIVPWAATDNLTELIAGGGSPLAALSLALSVVALAAAGSVLAARVTWDGRKSGTGSPAVATAPWKAALYTVVALGSAYFLLQWGAEGRLTKYGATFSALQFLLSPDRDHYVTGPTLVVLTLLAQGLGLAAVGAMQIPYWLQLRDGGVAGGR